MLQTIRHIFGENVRTAEPLIMIDGSEFTFTGVRAIIANLRARNEDLESRLQHFQNRCFALMKENDKLKKECSAWIDDWVKVPVKNYKDVDIFKA